jgi:hypothetical protein
LDPVELVGYAAAVTTVVTYAMRSMLPLRLAAIVSNVLFLAYAGMTGIYPQIVLHLVLLPFNLYRLAEMVRISRAARAARGPGGTPDLEIFRHAGALRRYPDAAYIFRKGAPPSHIYCIEEGRILLEEIDITLGPGEVFGEMAFFTDAAERTASARCEGPVRLRAIDEAAFMRIYFQSPAFALALQKLITRRLMAARQPAALPA